VGGTGWKQIDEVSKTTTVGGPYPVSYGQKYYFYVTAFDEIVPDDLESDPSNMVSWPIQVLTLKEGDVPVDVVRSGSPYNIEWYADPKAERFKLSYSANNGATWVPIGDNITGRSYSWTVNPPWGNKKNCFLKIAGFDSNGAKAGSDTWDVPFKIEVMKLLTPNGYELLTSNETYTITWRAYLTKNPAVKVNLSYTKDGGFTWHPIDLPDGYSGNSFDWQVPTVKKARTKCLVKVILKDEKGNTVGIDRSDDYFTIQP
jgi:hypothetical protein